MDPPASTAPSVRLTMTSSVEPDSIRQNNGIAYDGGEPHATRGILYDQLRNMIAQEERDGYKCCDYLSFYSPEHEEKPKATKSIDEGCRTSICGWMYRVADHFCLDREGKNPHRPHLLAKYF